MITCAEARKILYDLETTASTGSLVTEPGTVIALAKAHAITCMACSEYFERERGFISVILDRVSSLGSPVPEFALANVLAGISNARLEEFNHHHSHYERGGRNGIFHYLKKFFGKSK